MLDTPLSSDNEPLMMDFSDIGIPPTANSFAVQAVEDSTNGIQEGDIVLMERREPRVGELFGLVTDGRLELKRHVSDSDGSLTPAFKHICVAVGLARKF